MVLTILIFGAINFSISYTFVIHSAKEHIDEKVSMVAKVLAKEISTYLAGGDFTAAENLARSAREGDPEILYISVIDAQGRNPFLTNSSENHAPRSSVLSNSGKSVSIREKTFPIANGKLGSLVFGINENVATGMGRQFGFIMLGMTGFFLLLGIGGSIIFSYFISAPIYKILKGFGEFVPGGPMPSIRIDVNDEMRLLAQGFQFMMERINEIDLDYKTTQSKIIETERLASMGTLATGLAHEINNPIAGIQMCLRRLQKSKNLDFRQTEYLVLISDATNHIKMVVQDLLSYAQESDRKKEKIDLRKVVMDAANLVQPRLNRNNIHYHVDLPLQSCCIQGVKNHLVHVIVNGIINSIDAIDQGGNIDVSLRGSKDSFLIAIVDDGIGIDAEVAAKAFDPFFTTKGKKGTGLGLYVSFGIVKAHKGQIELKAKPTGRGTILTIELPTEKAYEYSHS